MKKNTWKSTWKTDKYNWRHRDKQIKAIENQREKQEKQIIVDKDKSSKIVLKRHELFESFINQRYTEIKKLNDDICYELVYRTRGGSDTDLRIYKRLFDLFIQ